ncbi:MAG TPA: murein L,D-transpeptidase catalytic domain family protein [Gemmatimonadaceae bacterium]|nr:murein L,D-transpeptidase catalytic domain family protein [Gemmatimonadaceae bacterium]
MKLSDYLKQGLVVAAGLVLVGAHFVPGADQQHSAFFGATPALAAAPVRPTATASKNGLVEKTTAAVQAFAATVRPLSHPKALELAFHSFFAFQAAHPDEVKKPLLYFVDYGLPSTQPRGYIFDMSSLSIIEGPFMVAHGRGSSSGQYGVPTHFSNASGSASTSLGLYVAENTYQFTGHTGGHAYSSVGLRLKGVSGDFNDNAFARGVVAHGAPYVTPSRAGRSEGCPAMEPSRANRVLPELANGGMVFLFAPDQDWMAHDPWASTSMVE